MIRAVAALAVPVAALVCCSAGPPRPAAPKGMVWVATVRDIVEPGVRLTEADVTWRALPRDFSPDANIGEADRLIGAKVVDRLLPGEPIRRERLLPGGRVSSGRIWRAAPAPISPDEDTVYGIIASRQLGPGVVIAEEDLYAVAFPPRFLTEGVYLTPEHVVGMTTCATVLANELVRRERLTDPRTGRCGDDRFWCGEPECPVRD